MNGYTKLFADIVTSTIWQEPNDCRVLWITMLALKDEKNICRATVPALAKVCNITIEDCEKYLQKFQEPDKWSRSQDFEGRRIEKIDGGWLILNGEKYRQLLRNQERRDYVKVKVAECRERKKEAVNNCNQCNLGKPIADTDTEAKADTDTEIDKSTPIVPLTVESQAEAIYNRYPKKVARPKAIKAIIAALKKKPFESLLAITEQYAKAVEKKDPQYIPYPASWFNAERFNDSQQTWNPTEKPKLNGPNI